jgi:hypothetical protein
MIGLGRIAHLREARRSASFNSPPHRRRPASRVSQVCYSSACGSAPVSGRSVSRQEAPCLMR